MSEAEIIKISSKGQVTIPAKFRKELSLDKDTYLYMAKAGKVLVLKKVDELSLDDISGVLGDVAKERGVTQELLLEETEKARTRLMDERNVQA